jgi:SAM-dependent methyltransferase
MENLKKMFDTIAEDYMDRSGGMWPAIRKYINSDFFVDGGVRKILDVANGGIRPDEIFFQERVKQLEIFIGNDINFKMLTRNNYNYQVNSDVLNLAFKAKSFDTVLVFSCIHHLTLGEYKDRIDRLKFFLGNLKELTEQDGCIYIVEATLPLFFERLEKFIYFPLYKTIFRKKKIPIYFYYYNELKMFLDELFECEFIGYKSTAELLGGRWKLFPFCLSLKWLKIPSFLYPYKYLFYRGKLKNL